LYNGWIQSGSWPLTQSHATEEHIIIHHDTHQIQTILVASPPTGPHGADLSSLGANFIENKKGSEDSEASLV
jgi:hypothetical protein